MSSFMIHKKNDERLIEWYFKYPEIQFIDRRLVIEMDSEDLLTPTMYVEYDALYLHGFLKVIEIALNSVPRVMLACVSVMSVRDIDFGNVNFITDKGVQWNNENIDEIRHNIINPHESNYGTTLNMPVLKLYRNVYMVPTRHHFTKLLG